MPKEWTPKKIAAAMKAKGLQKLRWYCQMCQKQCRDENGFKCHQTSEGHLRQMRIFAEDSSGMMERFSSEFEKVFMQVLSRQHGTKRVKANDVYREVIQDRHHVHMNSTHWATLTDFVSYLGKKGLVIVDDDPENGLHIQWIDRNPEKLAREEKWRQKQANQLGDAQRMERDFRRRQKALKRLGASAADNRNAERKEGDGKKEGDQIAGPVRLEMGVKKRRRKGASRSIAGEGVLNAFFQDEATEGISTSLDEVNQESRSGSVDAAPQELTNEQDAAIAKDVDTSALNVEALEEAQETAPVVPRLHRGLMVRILDKRVGGGVFYKTVGRVSAVEEGGFVAFVKVKTEEGRSLKLRVDVSNLEHANNGETR